MQRPWLLGVLVVAIVLGMIVFAGMKFSSSARLRRRRRKNYGRLVSKDQRPMVRFSVRPPKE